MIGYPDGIWDSVNNLPVIRKGITATHPHISWNGKTEFLTDIASFPGSSGSPYFLRILVDTWITEEQCILVPIE